MDYHQIVVLHRIVVSIFLLHYVIKLLLLQLNKQEILASYTAKTKILEMIISFLFLGTGIYLLINGAALTLFQGIKIALVFASIPLAVIGFKKGNKALAGLSVVFLIAAYGLAEMSKAKQKKTQNLEISSTASPLEMGKNIYTQKCALCHGDAGNAMLSGAKDLKITVLNASEQKEIIKNGKGGMAAYPDLTEEQLNGLIAYLETLK